MAERKWQMRRLDAGDYVCWSNDLTRLWRFHSYVDGKIGGLEVEWNRTFWRACWVSREVAETFTDEIPNQWESPWVSSGSENLPSRQAAVDVMLAGDHVDA